MKKLLKLTLITLMVTVATLSLRAHKPDHKSTIELLKDFVTLTQKTDKSFEYWIEQMSYHITNKDKFASFEQQLRSGLVSNKPQNVLKAFSDHKNLFGQAAQMELLKVGLTKLQTAFKERLALHQRLCTLECEATKQDDKQQTHLNKALVDALDKLSRYPHTEEQLREHTNRYQQLLAWLQNHN